MAEEPLNQRIAEARRARPCGLDSICARARDLVCELHAGLIEGARESDCRPRHVTPLGPDGEGGSCLSLG